MKKFLLLLLVASASLSALAQTGTLAGTVNEQGANGPVPMPFANVFVEGSTSSASTDLDGSYQLKLAPGSYTVVFSFIGYESDTVRNVAVTEGQTARLDRTMSTGAKVMKDFKLTKKVDRERETIQMAERKESTTLVQNIGAAELKK
ncbi:MAG: carboxypeptidase-like regulatory domain-containing protein, partial [Flavobacteriales bacterium]|nr:carboxypeptidase-like regulatory domain-containing protein [Flavobacteriales bacterium]